MPIQIQSGKCKTGKKITIYDDYAEVDLGHEVVSIIDVEDVQLVSDYAWYKSHYGYSCNKNNKRGTNIMMHRLIMRASEGEYVDHINRNPLDNRKSNLRICSHQQNCFNKCGNKNTTSKHRGVCWKTREQKWIGEIKCGDTKKYIGSYLSEDDAGRAYDKEAIALYGKFAYLNFPMEVK